MTTVLLEGGDFGEEIYFWAEILIASSFLSKLLAIDVYDIA